MRGILCFNCNTGLGKFKDNPELLEIALKYLAADKPIVETISKKKTKQELYEIRSKTALNQHRSPEGQTALKLRSKKFRGNNGFNVKLSDDEVQEIKNRYASGGISQQALADEYNVTQSLISQVVLGKRG